jgi:hypothetical protein
MLAGSLARQNGNPGSHGWQALAFYACWNPAQAWTVHLGRISEQQMKTQRLLGARIAVGASHVFRIIGALCIGLVCSSVSAQVQGSPTGWCIDRSGRAVRCSAPTPPPPPPSSSSSSSGSEATNDTSDRERELEAQRRRDEEARRKRAEELRRAEAEKKRKQEQWDKDHAAAIASLKGTFTGNQGLKGGHNTAFFGLKGTSSEDAAKVIKTEVPDRSARDVSTAWQQVHCAAELTDYAIQKARKLASDNPDSRDLDEVRYLAQEAGNALHGNAIGVQCSSAPRLKFTKTPDRAQLATTYEDLLSRTVKDAQTLYEYRAPAEAAKKKLDDAEAHLAEVKRAKPTATTAAPKPPVSAKTGSDSDVIAKAAAEQRAYQEKERQRINEVYQQAQKQQKVELDATAILREAQRQYNSVNSQKYTAERDLAVVDQQNKVMLKGEFPSEPK